jgi:hypothetical protein
MRSGMKPKAKTVPFITEPQEEEVKEEMFYPRHATRLLVSIVIQPYGHTHRHPGPPYGQQAHQRVPTPPGVRGGN